MQKELWEREYSELQYLPSTRTANPSKSLVDFLSHSNNIFPPDSFALDIGCGRARNSIYLAKNGFIVEGLDISTSAIIESRRRIKSQELEDRVEVREWPACAELPYQSDYFDLVLDMMTMHSLDHLERQIYSREVARVLKPGGILLLQTISKNGISTQSLIQKSPGPEINSYIVPASGMIEKAFNISEIVTLFSGLELVSCQEKEEVIEAFGDKYDGKFFVISMTRPL